jgi:hypothetical protein
MDYSLEKQEAMARGMLLLLLLNRLRVTKNWYIPSTEWDKFMIRHWPG